MPAQRTFNFRATESLPPLSWVARVRHPTVEVLCGTSVRRSESGFFEGTWTGGEALESVVDSTTPFGSGMVANDHGLFVVPPGHTLEGVYAWHGDGELRVSNSLVGLLAAADLQPVPDFDYVDRFLQLADGLDYNPIELPTSRGTVNFYFFENLLIAPDGQVTIVQKRRERPFTSYDDYFTRLDGALRSCVANAPGYQPVVALSNGYDSTAMAVLAARNGSRKALSFAQARPAMTSPDMADSGEGTARRLGMDVELLDRLAYLARDDLPEAEFLATGMPGEDVALAVMEPSLRRSMLVTGDVGAALWRYGRTSRSDLWRLDLSGCSLTEFRLRLDFFFVPLPVFGMVEIPSLQQITQSAEMKPWSIGGYYDRPIPRRIAEDAGIPRGSFAVLKHAATALVHQQGAAGMAPVSVESARAFAAAEGGRLELVARPRLRRRERFLLKVAHFMRLDPLVRPLTARQRALIHHEHTSGSILFRWAVATVLPRYEATRNFVNGNSPPPA